MSDRYIFRQIKEDEIPQMFQLILDRMKWMDENGIQQWNVTKYDEVYPQSYYEERRKDGEVFVLEDSINNHIVCAAVLKEEDERWDDNSPAFYLHNFVTKIGESGVGSVFIEKAETYAMQIGKRYFRLDSAKDNPSLSHYYEKHGFLPVGKCKDGLYEGILRQKELLFQNQNKVN